MQTGLGERNPKTSKGSSQVVSPACWQVFLVRNAESLMGVPGFSLTTYDS